MNYNYINKTTIKREDYINLLNLRPQNKDYSTHWALASGDQYLVFQHCFADQVMEIHSPYGNAVIPYAQILDLSVRGNICILYTSDREYFLAQEGFVRGNASTFLKYLCQKCQFLNIASVNAVMEPIMKAEQMHQRQNMQAKPIPSGEDHIRVFQRGINGVTAVFYWGLLIQVILLIPLIIGTIAYVVLNPMSITLPNIMVILIVVYGIFGNVANGIFALIYGKKKLGVRKPLAKHKKLSAKSFAKILICVTGVQFISILIGELINVVVTNEGVSFIDSTFTGLQVTWIGVVYIGIIAPISEEVIYRGIMLGALKRYGKVFGIVLSAVIFGMVHGNFTQGFFAAGIGLIYGYVAMEYSVKWTILLHIYNNLILAIGMPILLEQLPQSWQMPSVILLGILVVLGSVLILLWDRLMIKDYIHRNRSVKGCYKHAFGSAGIIVMIVFFFIFSLIIMAFNFITIATPGINYEELSNQLSKSNRTTLAEDYIEEGEYEEVLLLYNRKSIDTKQQYQIFCASSPHAHAMALNTGIYLQS